MPKYLLVKLPEEGGIGGLVVLGVVAAVVAVPVMVIIFVWTVATNLIQYHTVDSSLVGVRAAATAVARDYATPLTRAEVERAVTDQDWYVAAAILRVLRLVEPDDAWARSKLAEIADRVPGGVLVDGAPPVFYSFADVNARPLPNWPARTADNGPFLAWISPDAQRVAMWYSKQLDECYAAWRGGMSGWKILDIGSGRIDSSPVGCWTFPTGQSFRVAQGWAPDAQHFVNKDPFVKALEVRDAGSKQITRACAVNNIGNPAVYWMPDSTTVAHIDGSVPVLTLLNLQSATCHKAEIPGLNTSMRVLLPPNDDHLWVVAPGQLLATNADGGGIRKMATLPTKQWTDVLGSPDRGMWLVDGVLISARTGRTVPFEVVVEGGGLQPVRGVAWLTAAPPAASPSRVVASVRPMTGPRGTRFAFSLTGAAAGQRLTWVVRMPSGGTSTGSATVDQHGTLTDSGQPGGFGLATGAGDASGAYTLSIAIEGRDPVTATFTVTD